MQRVFITGATGILGKAIVRSAVGAGRAVRQAVRNPAKANPKAEAVRFDYADPSTIAPALEGISAMVLMAPPLEANAPALLGPVIAGAKAAGVQHVVLISAFGVNHNEQAPMRTVEHLVIDAGVPYTILRRTSLWKTSLRASWPRPSASRTQSTLRRATAKQASFRSRIPWDALCTLDPLLRSDWGSSVVWSARRPSR